jgi:hypothetical protein
MFDADCVAAKPTRVSQQPNGAHSMHTSSLTAGGYSELYWCFQLGPMLDSSELVKCLFPAWQESITYWVEVVVS